MTSWRVASSQRLSGYRRTNCRLARPARSLSVTAAERYIATVDHPDLIAKATSGQAGT